MSRQAPLLPDYVGANLAGLVPAFLASPGSRPDWVPEPARQFQLPGGEQISVRPLDRADGPRLQGYVRSLSPQARKALTRWVGAGPSGPRPATSTKPT